MKDYSILLMNNQSEMIKVIIEGNQFANESKNPPTNSQIQQKPKGHFEPSEKPIRVKLITLALCSNSPEQTF